ncbi:MAG: energy-coupling factor transport system ATP-binding protein [Hyphomicrobiales bacterium]|nr:energy-coupling factor transport system ATP-binding protein [Hyphomicrobiales bacterium]
MARAFVAGPNFSGRSAHLMARLRGRAPGAAFFIGPYAEAALSGLSSTVSDEIEIYRAGSRPTRPVFSPIDFAAYAARKPPTLSGGEQVLLALHCFSLSRYRTIGIDTALEQLDPANRAQALAYLSQDEAQGFDVELIDNRPVSGWPTITLPGSGDFACDLAAATATLQNRAAPTITIERLSFRYSKSRDIFTGAKLTLAPGCAYRLTGPNGAGKTTLFKLLAGVLAPSSGTLALDGAPYAPWRAGNRLFAFATQNPDHQWCGTTLGEDATRRRKALARHGIVAPTDTAIAALAACLGAPSLDAHLYELPLAARKRLSWLWPLSGTLPWIMLDEPTVGQDIAIRAAMAAAIARVCACGHGVMFVTHDEEFATLIEHRVLRLENGTITA